MRLKALTVSNFRGFGSAAEPIDLDRDLVLFYGPNGHGKTSLAEAVEWLFYGTTKRRQRGEGFSKAEYANTFANVHGGAPTEVALKVHLNGKDVVLSRRLGPKEASETFIDGAAGEFSSLGINTMEPFYPVVAQHGLQTFVHSKPKDRRDAICAAFGLEELVSLKSALDSARGSFQRTPPAAVIEARRKLAALAPALSQVPGTSEVARRWNETPAVVDASRDVADLLAGASDLTGQPCTSRADALQALRAARATVGRAVFDTAPIALNEAHAGLRRDLEDRLQSLCTASAAVDDAVAAVSAATAASFSAALLGFWAEGLSIAGDQVQCPMCEEPQRRAGQVHPGVAGAERSQVKLVAPQIFRLGPVRRQTEEGRELTHLPDIVTLRVLAKPADGHVLDHPLAQRTDGNGVDHGNLRGSGETTPKSSDAAPYRRNLSEERAATPSRESGLVRWRVVASGLCHFENDLGW